MNITGYLVTLAFLLQVGVSGSAVPAVGHRRTKRSFIQMCDLIQHHTNRGCLQYNNYGCFCGWGNAGTGRNHVDAVDGCCREHDNCYGHVSCWFNYAQLVGYSVNCPDRGPCECTDSPMWSPCAHSVCQCDLVFAQCLGQATYNRRHKDFPWNNCNRT